MSCDLEMWAHTPLDQAIDHILLRYHNVHRQQFDDLLLLAEKVSSFHVGSFPVEVLPLLQKMKDGLFNHMVKEENFLFPMILKGIGSGASMPINFMMFEHDEQETEIKQLLSYTNNLTAPEHACQHWRHLYDLARDMVNDLRDHIRLENEMLFPRVLAA